MRGQGPEARARGHFGWTANRLWQQRSNSRMSWDGLPDIPASAFYQNLRLYFRVADNTSL